MLGNHREQLEILLVTSNMVAPFRHTSNRGRQNYDDQNAPHRKQCRTQCRKLIKAQYTPISLRMLSSMLTLLFAFPVSTTFQLAGVQFNYPVSTIVASKFLKNPLNIRGIPFIAYNSTVCPPIIVVISEVGNSESNSFTVGVMVVFNLV